MQHGKMEANATKSTEFTVTKCHRVLEKKMRFEEILLKLLAVLSCTHKILS